MRTEAFFGIFRACEVGHAPVLSAIWFINISRQVSYPIEWKNIENTPRPTLTCRRGRGCFA
jgi:hypothetical protein